jgi:hypothetical protein
MTDVARWLLESDEPWTRYRTLVDLLDRPEGDVEVQAARAEMVAHPQVRAMITEAAAWPGGPIKRHNDAGHAIYKLVALADFGLRADDPGMSPIAEAVLAHQSPEGPFQSVLNVAPSFGGTGEDTWSWMACDAPSLVYALLVFGLGDDERVRKAVYHLVELIAGNGWRCRVAPELGKFRGPGRKDDPCPIANVYALKALSQIPELVDSPAAHAGADMLLWHWGPECERKVYLFGVGTKFRRLKYPFVWYDVLHVTDVLSRFPFVRQDARFREMVAAVTAQADEEGRYTAASMYRAWKGWSFADKKNPSPWLTFLALRIQKRKEWTD